MDCNLIEDEIKQVIYSKDFSLADRVKLLFLDNPFSKICCHTIEWIFNEYGDVHQKDLRVTASGILSALWKSKFMYLRKMGSCHCSTRQHFIYYFKHHPNMLYKGEFHEINT